MQRCQQRGSVLTHNGAHDSRICQNDSFLKGNIVTIAVRHVLNSAYNIVTWKIVFPYVHIKHIEIKIIVNHVNQSTIM